MPVLRRASTRLIVCAAAAAVAVASPLPDAGAQVGRPPAARPPTEVVRVPFPQEDGSLTPYTFELGYSLMSLVYDTLLWRDVEGVPRPWLARSADRSPDARRWTVRLDERARWHDGAPVTSADVAFTFRYVAEHPHPRFTPQVRGIERVETPDPATVVVTLRAPSPGFADQPLADVPILPAHIWSKVRPGTLAPDGPPVGSGPYRLAEHLPGQRYRFVANDAWFRGPPAVRSIEVPIISDAEQTFTALRRRAVDMIPVSLPGQAARRLRGLSIRVVDGPAYLGTVLMFNTRQPPFDRLEVRQALAQALDLQRTKPLGVGAAAVADRGYLHPASPFAATAPLHHFDKAGAQARLAGLGLPPVEVLAPDNDPIKREAGRQVALSFERAGLRASVKLIPRDQLSAAVGEDRSPPGYGVAIWVAPPLASYEPDFMRRVFGSDPTDAPLNYSGYRSAEFDEAARRVATTTDPGARRAAVHDALRILARDVPVVPLFFATGYFAYRPFVYDGWRFVKGAGILDKRSFVEPRESPAGRPLGEVERERPEPRLSVLTIAGLAVAGLAALVLIVALARRP